MNINICNDKHHPNNQLKLGIFRLLSKSYGRPRKIAENILKIQVILELSVFCVFRLFNKIKFSIDRCFQNVSFS